MPLASALDDLRATALLQSASEHAAGHARAATDGRNALHYNLTSVSVNTKTVSRRGGERGSRDDESTSGASVRHKLDRAHKTVARDIQALLATSRFLPGVHARAPPRQGMPVAWVYSRSIPSEVPSSPAVVRSSAGWAYPMWTWPHARLYMPSCVCAVLSPSVQCPVSGWARCRGESSAPTPGAARGGYPSLPGATPQIASD